MGTQAWIQAALLVAALLALSPALGRYLAKVFSGDGVGLTPLLGPVERASYRLLRVDGVEQDWKAYARALTLFSVVSWLGLYAVLRLQGSEPLNPRHFGAGPWDLSFNTASSFVSNTSWLMVGRTPEYLGKQIEAREMKLALLGTLAVPVVVLVAAAVALGSPSGRASLFAHGPQGFSESLYAYVSQGFNNGSAFAGYTGFVQPAAPGNAGAHGVTFADIVGGLVMLVGRYVPILTALALAGSLASRRVRPPGAGTLRTDTPAFGGFLIATVLLLALLTFVGGLLAGPSVQALTERLLS